mmetsp:Transcript_5512/g.14952  ORF Transcript_5512/g.14952 Transcript_5512/m.14952 type:complete len:280 (-) Transcript_5512:655-1494(-)|eukprot:CAMPEP_0198116852 /NCGR_PEP_ID=MMETSP1442-20131203/15014_1 /TAXON_ID= /ORGANISM="Craspedostauros australis, Strain CCMP3328" /LENGTH=279 /DNA_ID=CAMNT_0043774775 /DNA_START=105 /DNA_END=944 /DNA_ORIENTATION=+
MKCTKTTLAFMAAVALIASMQATTVAGFLPQQQQGVSATQLQAQSFLDRFRPKDPEPEVPAAIQGVGEEGCNLPSPSRVNTLAKPFQAKAFVSYFGTLAAGTAVFSGFLTDVTASYEWVEAWRTTWPLLGAVYLAAGITHFTLGEAYENIMPQKGAWGIWYLPGSAKFHVAWTGVAEILGGAGLLAGGIIDAFFPVYFDSPNLLSTAGLMSDSAACLFLLTIAVTPANIYMYTHGARLPTDGPEIPVTGHFIRAAMQIVLLGLLYQMGEGTFDAWRAAL